MKLYLFFALFIGLSGCKANRDVPVVAADNECLAVSQSAETLPRIPASCSPPSNLSYEGETLRVDFPALHRSLFELAAASQPPHEICACGCSFEQYAAHMPRLKAYLDAFGPYETARSCTETGCTSEPDDWTERGWNYFMRDLIHSMLRHSLDIRDGDVIDNTRILRHISQAD